jgi:hypothetical protein
MRERLRDRRAGAEPDDEKLRQLLDVEDRLEALVRVATEEAAQRVAAAVSARDARLAEAQRAAEREDQTRAAAEASACAAAIASIEQAAEAFVHEIRDLPGDRIDALARWVVQAAMAGTGAAP